jgi:D-alanyl-lipoteichoic acid acyltransferase DltB (MBOAT superfamily)
MAARAGRSRAPDLDKRLRSVWWPILIRVSQFQILSFSLPSSRFMLVETENVAARKTGRSADEAPRSRAFEWLPGASKFVAIVLQLGLLSVLIKRYNLESPAFFQLTLLAIAGFAVHYFLPLAVRLRFFLALSIASIVMVLGATQAAWLLGIGLALVGVCHVPLQFRIRVAILVATGALLALMRAGVIPTVIPVAIWPILASMFMFRIIIYLYDLYHGRQAKSVSQSLSYFFMLPNICFPLFPVVDFQAFCRRYYQGDPNEIYRVGVRWIFRGVVQLIIYRILYQNWGISLYEVENAGDVVHYCLWMFLLYLRVSGQFHIIVGMLHLFGFNLTETHHLYYLSHSFTDFWRRINIYWKDFLMRIIFYPAYFQFKRLGTKGSLVAATLCVFFMTWFLHALQWFWLRGSTLLSKQDMLFYAILAVFVVINSLRELKRGQKHMGGTTWRAAFLIGLRTLATFTVICVLWSMWTSESLTAWRLMWPAALVAPTSGGWLLIVIAMSLLVGCATLAARNPEGFSWSKLSFVNESILRVALILLLVGVSISTVNRHLGLPGRLIASSRNGGLNPIETTELERGYYENLMDVSRFNGELWNLYTRRPPQWNEGIGESNITQRTSNFLRYELKPSAHGTFKGQPYDINRWGMNDDDYSLKRPVNCYRIALLGASHAMPTGVDRDHDFETLVEERLNRENSGRGMTHYEMLNFAVAGYNPTYQIWVLEKKVLAFEPNAIFYVGHPGDEKRAVFHIVRLLQEGTDLHYPYLRDLARRADVRSGMAEPLVRRRLAPFGNELLSWTLRQMTETCKAHDIRPIYVLLPEINVVSDAGPEIRRAEEAGFTVLDLSDVYKGQSRQSLWVAEWDAHPNELGHQLIAQRLYDIIFEKKIIPRDIEPK